ncbi:hypothetical protein SNE40_004519 [Patella caerulea]|uniref:Phosphatidic acid phosphatase type 2/haloperoxidase domain-containing protein n=1 Tax=Patella caerulea TaxID=87958 RepID=A0AAN8Q136_PATCE
MCQRKTTFITQQIVIDVIIWCLVCVPVLALFIHGTPFKLGFRCDDTSIQYPYHPDSVSVPVLLAVGIGVPLVTMVFTELCRTLNKSNSGRRASNMWCAVKGFGFFLFGTMVAKVFTETLKFSAGRLRPHFIDICRPDFSKINCSLGYITEYECTNTEVSDKLMRDSRLSFPSGHASFAFFSAVFVVLYLHHRMSVNFSHLLRPTLQAAVMLLAIWSGVTRVTDNKHFTSDVVGGAVLGSVLAWITFYKVTLPNLKSTSTDNRDISTYAANSELEPSTPSPLLRKDHSVNNIILIRDPILKDKTMV